MWVGRAQAALCGSWVSPTIARSSKAYVHLDASSKAFSPLLEELARSTRTADVQAVLTAAGRVKKAINRSGDPECKNMKHATWRALLATFAHHGMISEALATLDDMRHADVHDADLLDLALSAAVRAGNVRRIEDVLQRMNLNSNLDTISLKSILPASSVHFTPNTYTHLLEYCKDTTNLEFALVLVHTAKLHQVPLSEAALGHVILCASDAREPRIAYELLEASAVSTPLLWMRVLRAAAEHDYAPALLPAWRNAVDLGGLVPDDGLASAVLTSASRAGLCDVIERVLEMRVRSWPEEPLEEAFLVPALDAYCESLRFDDALATLRQMTTEGIVLRAPLVAHLTATASTSDDALQSACEALERQKEVPTAASNALVYAAAERANVAVAKRIVHAAAVDTETYAALLLTCLQAGDIVAGMSAWRDMHAKGLAPSAIAYERMARMYLAQPEYDEAFALLEAAKHDGHVPTRRMYAAMVWTCWQRDDVRWKTLLHEMQEAQYEPGERLRELAQM